MDRRSLSTKVGCRSDKAAKQWKPADRLSNTRLRLAAFLAIMGAVLILAGCFPIGSASTTSSSQSNPTSCVNTTGATPTFNGQPVRGFGAGTRNLTIAQGQAFGIGESAGEQQVPYSATAPQLPWGAPTVTPGGGVLKAVLPCPTKAPQPPPTVPSASLYFQGVKPGQVVVSAPISQGWLAAPKPCDANPTGCPVIAPISISVTVDS